MDEDTQTMLVRSEIPNPQGQWRPGSFVRAEIVIDGASVPVAVREEALQTVEDRPVVFVKGPRGFYLRPVTLGRSSGGWVEINHGLSPGEQYASGNSFILKSEFLKNARNGE
jgi:cobalt-zinc-cadmium efflux system membrane fusion protein